jgi:hypothetical protein
MAAGGIDEAGDLGSVLAREIAYEQVRCVSCAVLAAGVTRGSSDSSCAAHDPLCGVGPGVLYVSKVVAHVKGGEDGCQAAPRIHLHSAHAPASLPSTRGFFPE